MISHDTKTRLNKSTLCALMTRLHHPKPNYHTFNNNLIVSTRSLPVPPLSDFSKDNSDILSSLETDTAGVASRIPSPKISTSKQNL